MYLLDTNALIILMYGEITNIKLSKEAISIINSSEHLCISIASLWEIAIKKKLGKLDIKSSIRRIADKCKDAGIWILPITVKHLDKTIELELNKDHHDPFDRLILSTTMVENYTLISTDSKMRQYGAKVIW